MAVIENRATELGDVLIIKTEVPIIGIVTLLSFTDNVSGETGDNYFQKAFRYSVDGINFSEYLALTTENVQGIVINPTDSLVIEYVYQRTGIDNSGSLLFNSVTLDGDFVEVLCGEAYDASMYSDYFGCNNMCSLNWSINVLEKLYKQGILAKYVERGKGDDNSEDRDFIDFWRSVTHYFALFVCLARTFSEFYADEELLKNYLNQRNLFFCDDIGYAELYYLMQNYYDEIRKRGTVQVIKEKSNVGFINDCPDESVSTSESISGSSTSSVKVRHVDGELLRLICYSIVDEFIFCLSKPEKLGWNIGNSSPMYGGMSNQNSCNKSYEDSQDIESLLVYPMLNSQNCDIITDEGKQVMHISNVTGGEVAGVGDLDFDKAIKIDPQLDYEITFVVKQGEDSSESVSESLGLGRGNLSFGCFSFNSYGNLVSLQDIKTQDDNDFFLEKIELQRDDKYLYIRGMIFNYNKYSIFSEFNFYEQGEIVSLGNIYYRCIKETVNGTSPALATEYWEVIPTDELDRTLENSLGSGSNLRFKSNANYIIPYIVLDNENSVGGELFIWDIKIKPVSTPYSHGFIQTPNFIHIWLKNRNGRYSDEKIRETMRKFLLPYDCTFNNIMLGLTEAEADTAAIGSFNEDFNDDFKT